MIVVPFFSTWHAPFVEAALSAGGEACRVLAAGSEEAVRAGLEAVNNDACYAALLAAGRTVELLRADGGASDAMRARAAAAAGRRVDVSCASDEPLRVAVPSPCVRCRGDDAPYLVRQALAASELGGGVPVIDGIEALESAAADARAVARLADALAFGDALLQARLRIRPYTGLSLIHIFDPKITAYDRVPPKLRLGYDKHPMYTQVYGNANIPNDVWDAMLTGEPWPVKVMISVANDPLGCFENATKIHEALMSDVLELNVNMDYFMTPGAELADIVRPAAHWSERVGNFDEELYPEPCPFNIPQKAVKAPGEAWDDWDFMRNLGKRFDPELWPWESSEEMQLWRLNEFHLIPNGKEPITDYEVAAKQGYFIEYGGESRTTRQHEKGLVKFQTPTMRIEVYSEQMPSYGYDSPLPSYNEPFESPYSTPELYKEYDLCLTTGARDYAFYHSAWTNIAHQRILEPWPYIELNEEDARERQISEGEWLWVESLRGKIKAKARISKGVIKGAVSMCRPNYKHACKELNLPGFDWDQANPNVLTTAEGSDPGFGAAPMRSSLCKVSKFSE